MYYKVSDTVRTAIYIKRREKMKKTRKRIFTAILCMLLASSALVSCSEAGQDTHSNGNYGQQGAEVSETEGSSSEPSNMSDGQSQDIVIDTYKEQISYYMTLTEALQADLIKLKEEKYISECEYQLKVEALEQTIQDLKDAMPNISTGNVHIPSQGDASNDQLSSSSDFKYETVNGTVTITEYIGRSLDVIIPPTVNGDPVTKIGDGAFKSKNIRSVSIPSGITEIDWFAFSGCTSLEYVSAPSSVVAVGYGAFDLCPSSLIIKCKKGSYIEAYAHSWGMKVESE